MQVCVKSGLVCRCTRSGSWEWSSTGFLATWLANRPGCMSLWLFADWAGRCNLVHWGVILNACGLFRKYFAELPVMSQKFFGSTYCTARINLTRVKFHYIWLSITDGWLCLLANMCMFVMHVLVSTWISLVVTCLIQIVLLQTCIKLSRLAMLSAADGSCSGTWQRCASRGHHFEFCGGGHHQCREFWRQSWLLFRLCVLSNWPRFCCQQRNSPTWCSWCSAGAGHNCAPLLLSGECACLVAAGLPDTVNIFES